MKPVGLIVGSVLVDRHGALDQPLLDALQLVHALAVGLQQLVVVQHGVIHGHESILKNEKIETSDAWIEKK